MNTQFTLLVSYPPDTAARLALDTGKGRMEAFGPLSEGLLDAGAKSVYWGEPEKNVHAPVLSRPGTVAPSTMLQRESEASGTASAPPVRSQAENTAVQLLETARRALPKGTLIELMNQTGIGLNASRTAIARLEACRTLRQFTVSRDGRKSAVYVALI